MQSFLTVLGYQFILVFTEYWCKQMPKPPVIFKICRDDWYSGYWLQKHWRLSDLPCPTPRLPPKMPSLVTAPGSSLHSARCMQLSMPSKLPCHARGTSERCPAPHPPECIWRGFVWLDLPIRVNGSFLVPWAVNQDSSRCSHRSKRGSHTAPSTAVWIPLASFPQVPEERLLSALSHLRCSFKVSIS